MIQTIVHCSTHVVTLKLNSSLGGRVLKAMIACMMLGSMAPAPHFWTFDMLIQTNKSPLDDKPPEPTPLKFNLQGRCKDYELRAFDLDLILFSSTNKIITIYKLALALASLYEICVRFEKLFLNYWGTETAISKYIGILKKLFLNILGFWKSYF